MKTQFKLVVADNPWRFKDKLPGNSRGASKNYECLSLSDLMRFPLPPIAPDAFLVMWRVASMVPEAYRVIDAWGARPVTEMVWIKTTKKGKRHMGMGRTVRGEHETAIIAKWGRPQPMSKGIRSTFTAPVGVHSEKPDLFYEICTELFEGPRVELFGRKHRKGWTVLGDQVGLLDGEK